MGQRHQVAIKALKNWDIRETYKLAEDLQNSVGMWFSHFSFLKTGPQTKNTYLNTKHKLQGKKFKCICLKCLSTIKGKTLRGAHSSRCELWAPVHICVGVWL